MSWTSAESWLIHTAVGGGLLLLLALVLMRLVRQPVRRQRLGEWGLAAALLVAILSLGPSWLNVPWLAGEEEIKVVQTLEPALPEIDILAPEGDANVVGFPNEVPAASPAVPEVPEGSFLERVRPWLFWIFSAGATLFLSHWLLGYLVLGKLLRDAHPAPSAVTELFHQMRGSRRRGRLLVSDRLPVPLSCGLFRPTIVLPRSMCEPPDFDKLRWVFAHELTHLERHDAWSSVLFGLGQTIYFYLPWFWSLRRQVRLCQEYIADAAAIQAVGASVEVPTEAAADYAEFLLSLTKSPAVPVAATGVSGNTSDLFRRVSMLLQNPLRVERRCSQLWSLVTGAVLLTAAIFLGGIDLTAEASDPAPDTIAELTPEQALELKTKVPVRFLLAAEDAGQGEKKVIILKPGQQADADVIIRKEPGQEKKIVIQRIISGQPKVTVYTSGDSQLDPLRKALEKLEKSGSLNAEQIRQEVMKALEKIKSAPAIEAGKQQRIEIRLHIDRDNKVTVTQPKELTPPPVEKAKTAVPAYKAVAVQSYDAASLAKAIEKLIAGRTDKSNAENLAREIEKLVKSMHEKKAAGVAQYKGQYVSLPMFLGTKIDFQAVRKLVEQLEKSPNDTKTLNELMKALGKGAAGGHGAFFYTPMVTPTSPVPVQPPHPAAPKPPALPKIEVKGLPGGQGVIVGDGGTVVLGGQKVLSAKSGQSRLGIVIDQPSALLADQLNLPKGQGLVISDVKADSPAAKAGLKANDILLEINKQKVPSNTGDFVKMIAGIKSGTTVDALVLRKGKRETITGITLAEATPVTTRARAAEALGGLGSRTGTSTISTTTLRTGDKFTTRYQEGSLIISVVGNVKEGKASVQEIVIQDGSTSHKHANVNDVPAQYRDKVNYIIELSAKGEFRTETKR